MNLKHVAQLLQAEPFFVEFTAHGHSMTPLIRSGEKVRVEVRNHREIGDIVLAKVHGRWYLHKVTAFHDGRTQIGNNKGHINGYASEIAGTVVKVGV